jgi:FkbM family methyltransferase
MPDVRETRRTLRTQGLDVQPIKTRAHYLKAYGFAPDVVIDVGVDKGTRWLYRSFPQAKFVLIDPREGCATAVETTGELADFTFHAVALGARTGTADLTVPATHKGEDGAMASLLPRTDKLADRIVSSQTVSVPMERLDDVAAAYPGRIGLKIDTEGFEMQVLQGGPETLKRCDFVILELSLTPRFAGVAPPSACMALLAEAGLELRDILHVAAGGGKRARPRYVDALFTRWTT